MNLQAQRHRAERHGEVEASDVPDERPQSAARAAVFDVSQRSEKAKPKPAMGRGGKRRGRECSDTGDQTRDHVDASGPAVQAWTGGAQLGQKLESAGEQRDGAEDHVGERLQRHALDHVADAIVDAEPDIGGNRHVAHRLDRYADRQEHNGIPTQLDQSVFHGRSHQLDLNSVKPSYGTI